MSQIINFLIFIVFHVHIFLQLVYALESNEDFLLAINSGCPIKQPFEFVVSPQFGDSNGDMDNENYYLSSETEFAFGNYLGSCPNADGDVIFQETDKITFSNELSRASNYFGQVKASLISQKLNFNVEYFHDSLNLKFIQPLAVLFETIKGSPDYKRIIKAVGLDGNLIEKSSVFIPIFSTVKFSSSSQGSSESEMSDCTKIMNAIEDYISPGFYTILVCNNHDYKLNQEQIKQFTTGEFFESWVNTLIDYSGYGDSTPSQSQSEPVKQKQSHKVTLQRQSVSVNSNSIQVTMAPYLFGNSENKNQTGDTMDFQFYLLSSSWLPISKTKESGFTPKLNDAVWIQRSSVGVKVNQITSYHLNHNHPHHAEKNKVIDPASSSYSSNGNSIYSVLDWGIQSGSGLLGSFFGNYKFGVNRRLWNYQVFRTSVVKHQPNLVQWNQNTVSNFYSEQYQEILNPNNIGPDAPQRFVSPMIYHFDIMFTNPGKDNFTNANGSFITSEEIAMEFKGDCRLLTQKSSCHKKTLQNGSNKILYNVDDKNVKLSMDFLEIWDTHSEHGLFQCDSDSDSRQGSSNSNNNNNNNDENGNVIWKVQGIEFPYIITNLKNGMNLIFERPSDAGNNGDNEEGLIWLTEHPKSFCAFEVKFPVSEWISNELIETPLVGPGGTIRHKLEEERVLSECTKARLAGKIVPLAFDFPVFLQNSLPVIPGKNLHSIFPTIVDQIYSYSQLNGLKMGRADDHLHFQFCGSPLDITQQQIQQNLDEVEEWSFASDQEFSSLSSSFPNYQQNGANGSAVVIFERNVFSPYYNLGVKCMEGLCGTYDSQTSKHREHEKVKSSCKINNQIYLDFNTTLQLAFGNEIFLDRSHNTESDEIFDDGHLFKNNGLVNLKRQSENDERGDKEKGEEEEEEEEEGGEETKINSKGIKVIKKIKKQFGYIYYYNYQEEEQEEITESDSDYNSTDYYDDPSGNETSNSSAQNYINYINYQQQLDANGNSYDVSQVNANQKKIVIEQQLPIWVELKSYPVTGGSSYPLTETIYEIELSFPLLPLPKQGVAGVKNFRGNLKRATNENFEKAKNANPNIKRLDINKFKKQSGFKKNIESIITPRQAQSQYYGLVLNITIASTSGQNFFFQYPFTTTFSKSLEQSMENKLKTSRVVTDFSEIPYKCVEVQQNKTCETKNKNKNYKGKCFDFSIWSIARVGNCLFINPNLSSPIWNIPESCEESAHVGILSGSLWGILVAFAILLCFAVSAMVFMVPTTGLPISKERSRFWFKTNVLYKKNK